MNKLIGYITMLIKQACSLCNLNITPKWLKNSKETNKGTNKSIKEKDKEKKNQKDKEKENEKQKEKEKWTEKFVISMILMYITMLITMGISSLSINSFKNHNKVRLLIYTVENAVPHI